MNYFREASQTLKNMYGNYCNMCRELKMEILHFHKFTIEKYERVKFTFKKNKKNSKKRIYSEEDLLEIMNLGMKLRQNQLSGFDNRSGNEVLKEWIENKNK